MTDVKTATIGDVAAAVKATNELIKTPGTTQEQLKAAAEAEQETVSAYLEAEHGAAQEEAQAAAEAG